MPPPMTTALYWDFITHKVADAMTNTSSAAAFLGTQGDVWDTQWDMFLALIGAITAQLLLSRLHDRQLARLSVDDRAG